MKVSVASSPLRDRIENFIRSGAGRDMLANLLNECVEMHSYEALCCVQRLFEDDYGGFTFNYELKLPAGVALIAWGRVGAEVLLRATIATPSVKNVLICIQVLACIASETEIPHLNLLHPELIGSVKRSTIQDPELPSFCRSRLVELVLSFEEDDVGNRVGHSLSQLSFRHEGASREVFTALAARWLAISRPLIEKLDALISQHPNDESIFQEFLAEHPQFLDPMVVDVWPQPDLHGARSPDFVLRRSDNSYLIIEIEKPAKPLVTKGGQLTADVTQAEKQVIEYKSFLMRRYEASQKYFPGFDDPDCLIIIGRQEHLSEKQNRALEDANKHRSHLKIVGFDWLTARARVIVQNIIQHGVTPRRVRMI
jgi:hypothetical protein